ncbi:hypothetical protein D3C75_908670 [compost metagenome]
MPRLQHRSRSGHILGFVCARILALAVDENHILGAGGLAPLHVHGAVERHIVPAFNRQRLPVGVEQEGVLIPVAVADRTVAAAFGQEHDMLRGIVHPVVHRHPTHIPEPLQGLRLQGRHRIHLRIIPAVDHFVEAEIPPAVIVENLLAVRVQLPRLFIIPLVQAVFGHPGELPDVEAGLQIDRIAQRGLVAEAGPNGIRAQRI